MMASRLAFSVGRKTGCLRHTGGILSSFSRVRLPLTNFSQLRCNQSSSTSSYNVTSLRMLVKREFSQGSSKVKEKIVEKTSEKTFLQKFLGAKEMPKRGTFQWYREMTLLCTVFAITGTSTMFLVRPAMSEILGLKGSLKDGPWTYRIGSLVIMTPLYATLLVIVGTVFGRHFYFRHFSVKMFSRFGIPPELMDSTFHETAKNFRKW